jgi:uncharacterized membrane protein SirB2
VGFLRDLLLFLHLLGMATLVGAFLLQLRIPAGAPLTAGWLHGLGLQLVTGLALMLLAPLTHQDYDQVKLGFKILVLVIIGVLAIMFTIRKTAPRWLTFTLGGLVVLNVGIAVFWH